MNLRAEPVLFLHQGSDMIPYVACTSDSVFSVNDPLVSSSGLTVAEAEAAMRKEARHRDDKRYDCVLLMQNVKK